MFKLKYDKCSLCCMHQRTWCVFLFGIILVPGGGIRWINYQLAGLSVANCPMEMATKVQMMASESNKLNSIQYKH